MGCSRWLIQTRCGVSCAVRADTGWIGLIPEIADQDLTGSGEQLCPESRGHRSYSLQSGIETIAHINEEGNGRMTIMFVAFDGPPRIVRLFGKGGFGVRGDRGGQD